MGSFICDAKSQDLVNNKKNYDQVLYIKMRWYPTTLRAHLISLKEVVKLAEKDSTVALVMNLLYGRILAEMFKKIVTGAKYLYKNQIVHRDLNPQNIFSSSKNSIVIGDMDLSVDDTWREEEEKSFDLIVNMYGEDKIYGTELQISFYTTSGQLNEYSYDAKVNLYSLEITIFEMIKLYSNPSVRRKALLALTKEKKKTRQQSLPQYDCKKT